MRKIFNLLFLLVIIFITPQSVCGKEKIGIVEFKAGVDVKQSDIDGLSAIFTTCFSPKGFTLVEREQIDQTIAEQRFQRSKLTQKQMVKIGKILNLSYIVIGDINIVYGAYNLDARVLNVETGEIVAKEGAAWKDEESYRDMMCQVANGLAGQLKPKEEPIPTPKVVKEKPKKEKKQPIPLKPVQPGFESSVEFSGSFGDFYKGSAMYFGGYRFNNSFFLGGGIGLEFIGDYDYSQFLDYNVTSVPILLHARYYLTSTRFQPFFALSTGVRVSGDRDGYSKSYGHPYGTCGFIISPAFGCNARITDNISLYLKIAYDGQTYPARVDEKDYRETGLVATSKMANAFKIALGLTF